MSNEISFPKNLLSNRNLKATSTRIRVLQLIHDYHSAIPYSIIQEDLGKTDRITLYRTIQTLLEKGIIHKAFSDKEETYYALCGNSCTTKSHSHNHAHFKCTNCESVTCVPLHQELSISLPQFKIENIHIHLTGLCKNCAA